MDSIKSERQWRQEEDARVLASAEQIKADKSRLQGAQEAAKRMLAEREKETAGLRSVADKSIKNEKSQGIAVTGFVLSRIKAKK